jgi:transcriptional regulator with XRE-family HTH domain
MSFGERLQEVVKIRRISQRELGRWAGLGSSHISMIWRGERIPGVDVAAKLARVLGVSLDWLADMPGREPEVLQPDEDELVRVYRAIDPALRLMALESLRVYPRRAETQSGELESGA